MGTGGQWLIDFLPTLSSDWLNYWSHFRDHASLGTFVVGWSLGNIRASDSAGDASHAGSTTIPVRYFSSLASRDLNLFPEGELRLSRGTADSLLMWVKGIQSCRTPSAVVSLALVLSRV